MKNYRTISRHLQNCTPRKRPKALRIRSWHGLSPRIWAVKQYFRYAIAAGFAVLLSVGASYFFWNQNQNLQEENLIVTNKIETLEADMRHELEDVSNQFIVLNNPQTRRLTVRGNQNAKELMAVAYINPVKKLSYINVRKLPHLPEDQSFQMWAEVNGEMLNLGVIEEATDKNRLMALPYSEEAIGYITIEPKGGNNTPTVKNIVANISY